VLSPLADGRWPQLVAIGKFDEMKNTNKIICQNISKELYKLLASISGGSLPHPLSLKSMMSSDATTKLTTS